MSAEQAFSSAEMKRMMKVQEVILKTMVGSLVAGHEWSTGGSPSSGIHTGEAADVTLEQR